MNRTPVPTTRCRTSLLVVAAALSAAVAAGSAQGPATAPAPSVPSAINIPFESYTLPNGLTVILSPDHTTPTVAVNVWYHVGSKNEVPGRTGFAHLFEHVMFTGSGHVPYGLHDKLTEGVGGDNNGTTSNDRTTYFETVPSNYLESALWLESDRMGFLLDTLDVAKLNAQRDIVKNERRQGVDNQPYGRVDEILAAATYPPSHPYSWDVIGSMQDLSAASEEDVKQFFRLYYAPNNAFLAVVGDFEPAQAKRWVERYFADIPRGSPITRPAVKPVSLPSLTRLVYEDRVEVPRLYVQWPTVGERDDDRFALDVLAAILTGPRTARLTKALVFDQQAAASVVAQQVDQRGRRRVPAGDHAPTRALAHRSRVWRPTRSSRSSRRMVRRQRRSRKLQRARSSASSRACSRTSESRSASPKAPGFMATPVTSAPSTRSRSRSLPPT